jgi:hypothetical protein
MTGRSRILIAGLLVVRVPLLEAPAAGDDGKKDAKKPPPTGKTPTELPRIPAPDPAAAQVAPVFRVAVAVVYGREDDR